jgi:hypothetical protein
MTSTRSRLAVALVILLTAAPAAAQDPVLGRHRLALLSLGANFPDEAWPEVEQRMAAELAVMGFEVVPFDARSLEVRGLMGELNEVATNLHAFAGACISFDGGEGIVRVWLDEEGADREVERSFVTDRLHDPDAVARIGLAAAEILQAVLLEDLLATRAPIANAAAVAAPPATGGAAAVPVSPAPAEARDVPPAAAAVESPAMATTVDGEPRRGRIWTALGVSVPFDPLFAQALVTLGGGYRFRDWLSLDAELSVTASPNDVAVPQDDVDFLSPGSDIFSTIYDATLTSQLTFHPWPRARAVRPALGLGVGMFVVWHRMKYYPLNGIDASFLGGSVAGIVTASLRFDFPVSRRGTVFVGATVGVAFPYTTIVYFGHRISSVGLPLLETVVGYEWALGRSPSRNR